MTPTTIEDLDRLVNAAAQDIIDLECGALGDHVLPVQLRLILWRLLVLAIEEQVARLARFEATLDVLIDEARR